ncbi:NAD-dependent succinate-semialdehyde dehydrogenase [Caballeronia sp. LjRoot34]|uniref:NAD-dependent succinate-semialdehyde dehydrogenase n=1 Tax=Caballeronia sp. LjRoot34 TaxID=3342325 RepID=UPI003ECD636F
MQTSISEFQTLNPANGKVVKSFPTATDAEVFAALSTAEECYRNDWRNRPVTERKRVMARAAAILREKAEEYAQYITLEMGKPIDQSRYEVELSAAILDYYASHAESFLKPQALPDAPGSVVVTEPIGVILAVEPWNFPYYQLARVAGPQMMAGNVVIIKHAPNVPQCALAFARLFEEAGAPVGAYTNLFATVDQVSALIDDFRVRGVTLTGSERAGAAVAERAGRTLKKAVLELGGSDPFIVLEDAPLEDAMNVGFMGRMICMGQACAASKRIIVVGKERGERFLEGLVQRIDALKVGDPADNTTTLGPLVSERALEALLGQIEGAKAHGARVVVGGKRMDREGFYLEPTIITDITPENPLSQQETFGPVASFYVVETEDEAIELANATKFGLGAAIFSANVEHAQKLAARIESGMVFINSCAITAPEVPFGGVKNSGYGRELSELGFGEFVNRKLIHTAPAA